MLDLNTLCRQFNNQCPLRILHCAWSDPHLVLGGQDWNLSLDTFWRVEAGGTIKLGYADIDSEKYFSTLVDVDVVAMRLIERSPPLDFELELSNGDVMVVFSLFRSENFVVRIKNSDVFVFVPD